MLEIIYNVCYALDYIHDKGYVHLDIKPSNIMLTTRSEVKLMDFGISRFLREEQKDSSKISGTSYYLSPEQATSDTALDHSADIFSLDVVLYELLTGKRSFEGKNFYETIYKIVNADPIEIRKLVPDVPLDLELIVNKAISKNKQGR